jgi:nucleoid DNA-binding protein
MNRSQAVAATANRVGITPEQAEASVSAFLDVLADTLVSGEPVALRRFGKFEPRLRRAMSKPNPGTGELMDIPERLSVAFLPSDLLKNRLNKAEGE